MFVRKFSLSDNTRSCLNCEWHFSNVLLRIETSSTLFNFFFSNFVSNKSHVDAVELVLRKQKNMNVNAKINRKNIISKFKSKAKFRNKIYFQNFNSNYEARFFSYKLFRSNRTSSQSILYDSIK